MCFQGPAWRSECPEMEREPGLTYFPGVVWTLAWGYLGITPWEPEEILLALGIKEGYIL